MEKIVFGKFTALDGHPCKTQEEMEAKNEEIRKLLLPRDARQTFWKLQARERAEWFMMNVTRRDKDFIIQRLGFEKV